jgi:3-deoxy-D-arabino-heptulosonate 7-phosphate (DAHP) synthase class II
VEIPGPNEAWSVIISFTKNKSISKIIQKEKTKNGVDSTYKRVHVQVLHCVKINHRTQRHSERHSELTRSVSDDFGSKVGPKDEFTIPSNALDQF